MASENDLNTEDTTPSECQWGQSPRMQLASSISTHGPLHDVLEYRKRQISFLKCDEQQAQSSEAF
jgi:hypothetical protein